MNKNNSIEVSVITGLSAPLLDTDNISQKREKAVWGTVYRSLTGLPPALITSKDHEIYEQFRDNVLSRYDMINNAILNTDIVTLQNNIDFILSQNCYHWVINTYHLDITKVNDNDMKIRR